MKKFFKQNPKGILTQQDLNANDAANDTSGYLKHCSVIIGVGIENGLKYYRIKNSYGTQFADMVFMRIAINSMLDKDGKSLISFHYYTHNEKSFNKQDFHNWSLASEEEKR